MKKLIPIILCIVFSKHDSFAQVEKGNYTINGGLRFVHGQYNSYNSYYTAINSNKRTSTNTTLNIGGGYFFENNFLGGLAIQDNFIYTYYNPNESKQNNIVFGPFLRYYKKFNKHAFFLAFSYQYGILNNKFDVSASYYNSYYTYTIKEKGITSELIPGLGYNYFISPNIALEFTYNYYIINEKITYKSNSNIYYNYGNTDYEYKREFGNFSGGIIFYFKSNKNNEPPKQ